jgi:hypothetical protein
MSKPAALLLIIPQGQLTLKKNLINYGTEEQSYILSVQDIGVVVCPLKDYCNSKICIFFLPCQRKKYIKKER